MRFHQGKMFGQGDGMASQLMRILAMVHEGFLFIRDVLLGVVK